ncbi:hypothetical protein LI177_10370 [bacterium 210820-DFI.6.37]|nr:hypothetical protein [bacterium 210820-DFI.6.37]
MLKKVDPNDIFINQTSIETNFIITNKKNIEVSLKKIYEVINNNIGVQIALSEILLIPNDAENIKDIISFVSLEKDKEKSIDSQLDELWMVFKSVYVIVDEFKNKIACQVSEPTPNAIRMFVQSYNEQRLSKWIYTFHSGRKADDCNEIALYEYINDGSININLQSLQEEPFFQYVLYSRRNCIIQPGLLVSQYELSEVDSIPYIREICSIVNNLYIMIRKSKDINSKEFYEKYLTWK